MKHFSKLTLLLFCLVGINLMRAESALPTDSTAVGKMRAYLDSVGTKIHQSCHVTLLPGGQEKFDDLFAHIQEAKDHIHLEYFNFRNDSISDALFRLLAQRAKAGVEVRILFDAFGNASNDSPIKKDKLELMRAHDLKVVKFDPINFPWINHIFHRDHRKIVVIDGKIGYTGGINVADYYIKGLPKIGKWRDMHIRLQGSAVRDLQRIFVEIWSKETGEALQGDRYFPSEEALKQEDSDIDVAIVDRTPRSTPRAIRQMFKQAISSARENIRIVNPYFVPTSSIRKALQQAIDRGVRVEIMISSRADIPFTPDAALHKLRKLAKRGATVYLYQDGFHHSKILTVDGKLSSIGSANLNSRSLRYDYEVNAVIFSEDVAREFDDVFEKDKEHCLLLDDEFWHKRSSFKKAVGWFANLLTPFL